MHKIFSLFFMLLSLSIYAQKRTISGYVYEKGSRESLVGVNVYNPDLKVGTTTNAYGFYSLTMNSKDSITIRWSFVGFKSTETKLLLKENVEMNIFLEPSLLLKEVVITGETQTKVSNEVRMSVIEINPKEIKSIPALLGEKDVFKALQLMPGVQKGNEGSSGIYVRGGGPDQNLIILDEAIVYNASHLFGFFSLFNGDALKSIELTKGGFPARYGGRLSSVVEMTMKDGNKQKFGGEAGVGIISSRLLLEGPIVKDKSSFIISGRRTYIDILMQPFIMAQTGGSNVGYYFYDLNAKANYDFGNKNKLFLSGYFGRDKFYMNEKINENSMKAGLFWQNSTATLRWNHLFNNKLFSNASIIFSDYTMDIYAKEDYMNDFFNLNYISGIQDYSGKYDLYYHPSSNHSIRGGFNMIYHIFTPGAFVVKNSDPSNNINLSKREDGIENSIYLEDEIKTFKNKIRLNPGIRLTSFIVKDKAYWSPEPRFSGSYMIKPDLSVKISYASMSQFLHLLSNTGVGLPTDLWVPSTKNIQPQKSWQVAVGMAKDFSKHDLSLTIEGYYKKSDHIIGYKEGASFIGIEEPTQSSEFNWEQNITSGQAWSYGAEILFRKNAGKFTGWIGYTISWTQMQFDELNFGKKFWARYDRRHDISLVAIYNITDNLTISGTWVYGTGNAVTLPKASYNPTPWTNDNNLGYYFMNVSDYGEKNSFRMVAYHRLDIGMQFHRIKPKYQETWELGVYNLYNRQNPFFYYISTSYYNNGTYKNVLKQASIFPLIPSLSWSIKF